MPASRTRRRFPWHTVVVAAVTLASLWWFFHGQDFGTIWRTLGQARIRFVLLSVGATLLTYVFRAWRWQALLWPIGRVRFRTAFRTTVIGFTASFLLPGRIGEVLRPYLLARQENLNAGAAFATVIVERFIDMATVLLLFALFLVVTSVSVGPQVKTAGALAAVIAVAALAVMAVSAGHPQGLANWAGRVARLLPGKAADTATAFVHTFVEGLAVMRRPGALVLSFVLSIAVWLSIALGAWAASLALGLTFPFVGSFLVVMFLVVGIAVPTPAGVGSFDAMYEYSVVTFFAAPQPLAVAAAIVLHAISVVPVSLLGLLFMAQDGLTLANLRQMKSTAEKAEHQS